MERLLYNAYLALAARFDMAFVGPLGCESFLAPDVLAAATSISPIARFLAVVQWRAIQIAKRFRPDVVVSGSGVTAPAGLVAARLVAAKVACFVHGLDLVADSVLYRSLFLPAVIRCDHLIANSRNTLRLATQAGADFHRTSLLHPGVALPNRTEHDCDNFRATLGITDRKILLSVGRLNRRKGLSEFIRHSLPAIAACHPDVVLVVIGNESKEALKHAAGERERIVAAIETSKMGRNALVLGGVDDRTLSAAYEAADLFVFPVIEMRGDVEGFGMVALEAAAHGLPTVAFAVGGVPDAVDDGTTGYLVPPGNYNQIARIISDHLNEQHRDSWRSRCVAHAERFTWEQYGERLCQTVRTLPETDARTAH